MAKSKSPVSRFAFYAILLICVLAMGGFGITGIFSQSQSASVATVGDEDVSADDYFRALQNELNQMSQQFGTNLTIDQAIAFGLDQNVLARLVQEAAFRGETNRMGVSVSDETVREVLLSTRGFQGIDGQFDQTVYRDAIRRAGLSTAEYEELLRNDAAQQIVIDSVVAGISLPDQATLPLFEYLGENRAFNYIRLTEANIIGTVPAPTADELQAYYDNNPQQFEIPVTRKITYAALLPSELAETLSVPEEEVQALYDARSDEYETPERRFVERIVFGSLDEANDAVARIVSGDTSFNTIAEERGLDLSLLDLGDITRGDVSKEAADLLFATEDPGIYGPAMDDLGPSIYRVNAAIAAQSVPLDEVYDDLAYELAIDLANFQIGQDIDRIVDLVAGGATIEELAETTSMTLGTISWPEGNTDGIAAYTEFRDEAVSAEVGEERDLIELPDGGLLVLRVDEIREPELKPYGDVQDEMITILTEQNTLAKIRERAEQIVAAVNASGGSVTDFANLLDLDFVGDVARTSSLADLPAGIVDTVFALETGETAILDDGKSVVIVELWSTTPFDPADPELAVQIEGFQQERDIQVAEDVLNYFGRALIQQADPVVNRARIDSLHLQLQ